MIGKIGFEPMINIFYNNFQNCHFKPLSHLPKKFRVTGFEPVIFYAQDKHDTITLYPIFIKFIKYMKKNSLLLCK